MREGQEKATRARSTLAACGIEVGADFRALSTSQIDALLAHAEQHRLNKRDFGVPRHEAIRIPPVDTSAQNNRVQVAA